MQTNIMDLFSFHEKITKNSFERIESQKGFAEVKDLTTKVYDQSQDDLKIFFDIVKGLRWNDYPNMQIMCLPQRFLGVDSIGI